MLYLFFAVLFVGGLTSENQLKDLRNRTGSVGCPGNEFSYEKEGIVILYNGQRNRIVRNIMKKLSK